MGCGSGAGGCEGSGCRSFAVEMWALVIQGDWKARAIVNGSGYGMKGGRVIRFRGTITDGPSPDISDTGV